MEAPSVVVERDADLRPLDSDKKRVCSSESRRDLCLIAAAELCGTALLVLLPCLPGCGDAGASLLQRAFTGGLIVALIVQCFNHISGAHLNPTVTLAAVLSRRYTVLRGVVMFVAQMAGGTLGAAALRLLSAQAVHSCVTKPASHISVFQALVIETLLGLCLALANLASWDARNQHLTDSWPLRIGAVVTALSLAAGDLTGASMNPVRSFAPSLLSWDWDAFWVYWAGPLCGSCAATALYVGTWHVPPTQPQDASPATRRRELTTQKTHLFT